MAKLSVKQLKKIVKGFNKIIKKLEELETESIETYSFRNDALGLTFLCDLQDIGFEEYCSQFDKLFGFKPKTFSSYSYKKGLTNIQKDVTKMFLSSGTVSKHKWISEAKKLIKTIEAKIEQRATQGLQELQVDVVQTLYL